VTDELNEKIQYKVIVSLFADDTTVYLSEKDKYADLDGILNLWCRASGAKFNISKTRIIPVGTSTYRKLVNETRKISVDQPALPEHINIAPYGKATRISGAWLGNGVNQLSVWTPTVEKIKKNSSHWANHSQLWRGRLKLFK
jgi:hypothetical protein